MNRIFRSAQLVAFAATLFAAAAASANAQTHVLRVDIPFRFAAGNTILPAGQYFVTENPGSGILRVDSLAHYRTALLATTGGVLERKGNSDLPGVLRFVKYGNLHVLRGVWYAGRTAGKQLPASKVERELAAALPGAATELEIAVN